jgi:hypothetical protein
MAPVARRVVDVDDGDDPDLYDPKYLGRKVFRDGCGPRVRLMLTDAAPRPRPVLFDASAHRPHYAVVDRADPHVRAAEAAYEARNAYLRDAWRTPSVAPTTGAPEADQPDDDEDPRDAYIRRVSNAWRTPPDLPARDPDDGDDPKAAATAVEAQRRRWNAESPAKDAAVADRDVSYDEYIHRLTTAWKRPYGPIRGRRR